MFRHDLAPIAKADELVILNRHHQWSKMIHAETWLTRVSEQFAEACEQRGNAAEARRWNDEYQGLLDRQMADTEKAKNYLRRLEEAAVRTALETNPKLGVEVFDNFFSQIGLPLASCSFVASGLFFAVWPLKALAKTFMEGYAVTTGHTHSPCCILVVCRGVTYTATTLVPVLKYKGIPAVLHEVCERRKIPKGCCVKKGIDGRWYVVTHAYGARHPAGRLEMATILDAILQKLPASEPHVVPYLRQRGVTVRSLTSILPRLYSSDHRRMVLLEIIARFCKNLLNLEIIKNKTSQTNHVMYANRLMACIGGDVTFPTIILNMASARIPEIAPHLSEITAADRDTVLSRFHEIAILRSHGGQVLMLEPQLKFTVRVYELVAYASFEAAEAIQSPHVADIVEGLHTALRCQRWDDVRLFWERIPPTCPCLIELVCKYVHANIRSCDVTMLSWYHRLCGTHLAHTRREYVLASDVLASMYNDKAQRVYAMMSWERLAQDILSGDDDPSPTLNDISREAICHWLEGCVGVVTQYRSPVTGAVTHKCRKMLSNLPATVERLLARVEKNDPEFAFMIVIRAARIMLDISVQTTSELLAKSRLLVQELSTRPLTPTPSSVEKPKEKEDGQPVFTPVFWGSPIAPLVHLKPAPPSKRPARRPGRITPSSRPSSGGRDVSKLSKDVDALEADRDHRVATHSAVKMQRRFRCNKLLRIKQTPALIILQRLSRGMAARRAVFALWQPVTQLSCQRFHYKALRAQDRLWHAQKVIERALRRWVVRSSAARAVVQRVGRGALQRLLLRRVAACREALQNLRILTSTNTGESSVPKHTPFSPTRPMVESSRYFTVSPRHQRSPMSMPL